MGYTVSLASLGCPKNQVDAEMMLASLAMAGYEFTAVEEDADVIIVNTCAFIEEAKSESIDVILDLARLKKEGNLKLLVATGCMAERYREQMIKELPELDAVVGIGSNKDIVQIIDEALRGGPICRYGDKSLLPLSGARYIATPHYMAYIKIAEGCDNNCTYCAIPNIRGPYRSRPMADIIGEVRMLALRGVKEIILVAQDTTRWGEDLEGNAVFADLLEQLCKIEGIKWIRILYAYPEKIDDRLISVIRDNDKIVKYLDIPLQHSEDGILRRMNRRTRKTDIIRLINKLRSEIPGIVLRTSIITGFPGETEEDFSNLLKFIEEMRFEKLGCFAYSCEEDTPAAAFDGQIVEEVKRRRQELVMELQQRINDERNTSQQGSVIEVLTEGWDGYIKMWYGRSFAEAPDIDGMVFFRSKDKAEPGEFVTVRITGEVDGDLCGEAEEKTASRKSKSKTKSK